MVEGGGMQQGLECGAGLSLPESSVVHAATSESGAGGQAGCTGHRRERVVAVAHRRPAQPGR